ncbi:MAG TPA: hypothetical protein VF079_04640 [Sphingomicrobium sp.]
MIVPLFALMVAAAPDAAQAPPAKPLLICRASEREVGSRIRKGRQCKTAEQWALVDAERDRKPADMRVTQGQSTPTGLPGSPH